MAHLRGAELDSQAVFGCALQAVQPEAAEEQAHLHGTVGSGMEQWAVAWDSGQWHGTVDSAEPT